ncbi:hypothetical protein, partial [Herbiconiux daphne]
FERNRILMSDLTHSTVPVGGQNKSGRDPLGSARPSGRDFLEEERLRLLSKPKTEQRQVLLSMIDSLLRRTHVTETTS